MSFAAHFATGSPGLRLCAGAPCHMHAVPFVSAAARGCACCMPKKSCMSESLPNISKVVRQSVYQDAHEAIVLKE